MISQRCPNCNGTLSLSVDKTHWICDYCGSAFVNSNAITTTKVLEMAKNGWDAIVEMYKQSTPEQREKILKILGGIAGFSALLKYLKSL